MVHVTAGKPDEFAFELSRWSALPAGTLSFVVTNEGATDHDFVLCETPSANMTRNDCLGYQSKDLQPGQRTRITISGIKKGDL